MSTTIHEGLAFEDPTVETTEQNLEKPEVTEKTEEVKEVQKNEEKVEEVKTAIPPTKFDGESDVQYNLRLQLFNAGLAKATATDEEKSIINEQIKNIRSQLSETKKSPDTTQNTQKDGSDIFQNEEEKKVVLDNIRKLGFVSKEEVEAQIQQAVKSVTEQVTKPIQEAKQREQADAITQFYKTRPDIYQNQAARDTLEKAVVERFKISPDTSKSEILEAMDMVATYLFPKGSRSKQADDAQGKIDLMNISGTSNGGSSGLSMDPETVKTLKESGWSDDAISGFAN